MIDQRQYFNRVSMALRMAVRSLLIHKLRSALSILGIICGVMVVLSMLSIGEGAKMESLRQIEKLGTNRIYIKSVNLTDEQKAKAAERLSAGLSLNDVKRMIKHPDIQDIAFLKEIEASVIGMIRDITPLVVAASSNYARVQNIFISQGRFITDNDVRRSNLVCVLGDSISQRLGPDGRPGSSIRIENDLFRVAGVLKRYDQKTDKSSVISVRNYNEMIFIPYGTENDIDQKVFIHDIGPGKLSEVVIKVSDARQVTGTGEEIRKIMDTNHGGVRDYQIIVPQELLRQSQKTQRTFNVVLGSIAFISLLVGGIGIMNIMLANVSERTREIGIRRAVGASRRHIIVQFLAESVVLTFTGGLIGIATGIGGVWFITELAGWKTAITLWSLLLPLIMSVVVGIFFGLYPAYQAAGMDPIAALRHE